MFANFLIVGASKSVSKSSYGCLRYLAGSLDGRGKEGE